MWVPSGLITVAEDDGPGCPEGSCTGGGGTWRRYCVGYIERCKQASQPALAHLDGITLPINLSRRTKFLQ